MNTNKENSVEGYVVSDKVSNSDRALRIAGNVALGVSTALAGYAAYQAAAHTPEAANLAAAIGEKMSHGVSQTCSDVSTMINYIIQNPDLLKGASPGQVVDLMEANNYHRDITSSAFLNTLKSPFETLASAGLTWFGGKQLSDIAIKGFIWKDKPDFNQRLRNRITNSLRPKESSRKIEIPEKGGNKFIRK